ncbi:WXG100 family type VII secretion target [Streptomyces sp. NPDC054786]
MTDSGRFTDIHKHGKNVEFTKNGKHYEISQQKLSEFRVDLDDLHGAIGDVQRSAQQIKEAMHAIDTKMNHMHAYWNSPSYQSYDDMRSWFQQIQHRLYHLLEEIIKRMNVSYQHYHSSELANLTNMTSGKGSR